MAAFFWCVAGWTALALSMDRHYGDAFTPLGNASRWRYSSVRWLAQTVQRPAVLRATGWALLVLSLCSAATAPGAAQMSMRVVHWAVCLSISALAVSALFTWQPRCAGAAAALAVAAALCTTALGG